jgi:DNA-binding NarL/FixJ family response regulator
MEDNVMKKAIMRVLLADDHRLVRAGLRALLDATPDIEVVAEATDGEEAMSLIRQLQPDVALLDIAMPKLSGLAVLHQVTAAALRTRVLLLSMYDNDEYVAEAIRAGAAGYLVKDAAVEELGLALQALERGDVYLSPAISRKLAQAFSGGRASPGLTGRQTEILRLIAQGNSSKEIARDLGLSIKTVETHRTQIMDRLDIRDLAGLVRYAIRSGLIGADR